MQQNFWVVVLFVIVALAVVIVSNVFVYYSLIRFFKVINPQVKIWIMLVLFVLFVSFILSSIIAHWYDNWFSRGFYFVGSLWLGIITNIMMAFLLCWILLLAVKLTGLNFDLRIIGIAALALAFVYSGYGIWNAYHPVVKNITVKIRNLPPSWQSKKIVQISDIHLGHIWKADFLKKSVDRINEENPEIVFITGDLFDGMNGKLEGLVEPINSIKAPKGTYFITGNHETYLGTKKTYEILEKTNVNVFADSLVDLDGLQIIGVSYPERSFSKDIAGTIKNMAGYDSQKPTILLYHDPVQIDEIKELGIDFQLSGHTHAGQIIPVDLVDDLIYGKYYNGLHQEGNYTLYTTSGLGTWGPTMRTGNRPEIVVIKLE